MSSRNTTRPAGPRRRRTCPRHEQRTEVCDAGGPTVALIVEADLGERIRPRLSRFADDLCAAGYRVSELRSRLRSAGEVRGWLMREHARTGGTLEGAILAGDFPRAYQWVVFEPANPSLPTVRQEVISLQYYGDLDYADNFLTAVLYGPHSQVLWSQGIHTRVGRDGHERRGLGRAQRSVRDGGR